MVSGSTVDLRAWNRALNRTHAMADMRARAGRIVRAIEERRRRLVCDRVRRLRPRLVVDVGCEDGWIAEGYVDAVEQLVLADLDPDVLAAATLCRHPRVEAVVVDATQPRALEAHLAGRRPDLIVLCALLEHLPRPAAALDALRPLLAPGGRFLVYLPADGPILMAKAVLKHTRTGGLIKGLSLAPAPGHLHRFARRDVAGLLAPYGVIEEISFDPVCLGYVALVRSA